MLKILEIAEIENEVDIPSTTPTLESPGPVPIATDTAFLFHTSGTSSGLPKPIPQTHNGAIGVLPRLPNGYEKATFTTTPLYHGGIADCFRAWTSGALIWLFPGKDKPITAANILKCLQSAKDAEISHQAAPIKYFSSVPYVLQMLSAESEGLKTLQEMHIVGVGGAALSPESGDLLVSKGVNLVSRFGSAECGFLLSSHRDYEKDQEWQCLRSHGSDLLQFETQSENVGLSELVVRRDWPHMAKRNREDGSFATADLFAPHPTIKNAWKYHSRADSQLTLITGKKFDPAPLEAAISSHDLLSDVLIFGNGKQSPGALLFRSEKSKNMDGARLLAKIWPTIDRLNKEGQAHTRLSRKLLIAMDPESPELEKSSKGTTLRTQAENRYRQLIEAAYNPSGDVSNGSSRSCKEIILEHEIPTAIMKVINEVVGNGDRIPDDVDLFSYGVDSVACMTIRARLQATVLGPEASELPLNIIYDCGNINRLSRYLLDVRQDRATKSENELESMRNLVDQYSKIHSQPIEPRNETANDQDSREEPGQSPPPAAEHVILTGATGTLGAHILYLLRSSSTFFRITCLVRAASPLAAHERVSKSLIARGNPGLPSFSTSSPCATTTTQPNPLDASSPHVVCLPTTFSHPTMGLDTAAYTDLAKTSSLIIHAAWAVNFTARLRSFEKDHIAGLSHLLSLSLASSSYHNSSPRQPQTPQPRFLFLSSTASVTLFPSNGNLIPERLSRNPEDASPLGYSRSKWVAEQICNNFHNHLHPSTSSSTSSPRPNIAILRIGQLCGDTQQGIWNMSEAYPLMLSTAPVLHVLPDLGKMPLDWMPVDRAAEAVVQIAESLAAGGSGDGDGDGNVEEGKQEVPVFHILNPHTSPTWKDLVNIVQRLSPGLEVEALPKREWLEKLVSWEGELPAKKLVGLWREGFSGEEDVDDNGEVSEDGGGGLKLEIEKAKGVSAVMRDVQALDEGILGKMWMWILGQVDKGGK